MSSFNSKIKKKKAASDEIAMAHALNICHNIQVQQKTPVYQNTYDRFRISSISTAISGLVLQKGRRRRRKFIETDIDCSEDIETDIDCSEDIETDIDCIDDIETDIDSFDFTDDI